MKFVERKRGLFYYIGPFYEVICMTFPSELSGFLSLGIEVWLNFPNQLTPFSAFPLGASFHYGKLGGAKAAETLEMGVTAEKIKSAAVDFLKYAAKTMAWNIYVKTVSSILKEEDSPEAPGWTCGLVGLTAAVFMGTIMGACRNQSLKARNS